MSELSARLRDPLWLSGGAMVFVGAVLFGFFHVGVEDILNAPLLVLMYAFAGLSVAFGATGAIGSLAGKVRSVTVPWSRSLRRRLGYSAGLSLFLTLISFFVASGLELEGRQTGFPFAFASSYWFLQHWSQPQIQPIPAVLDFVFWFAVTYLFVLGVPFRWSVVRGICEASVGVIGMFFLVLMSVVLLYQNVTSIDLFGGALCLFLGLLIGYAQIRRGFPVMGSTALAVGIVLMILCLS